MAAPADKKFPDVSGKWYFNKSISDSLEPILALQGIGWVTRKAIGAAGITMVFSLKSETDAAYKALGKPPKSDGFRAVPSSPDERTLHMDQLITGGVKGTAETRTFDGLVRAHSDWLFGTVEAQNQWITHEDVLALDPFLSGEETSTPWLPEETFLWTRAESPNGWVATQVWGFQDIKGERKFVRHVLVTKADKSAKARLINDWLGPA